MTYSPTKTANSLRSERNRFAAFTLAAADAVFEVNSDFTVRFAAGAIKALLGQPPEKVIGTSFAEHFSAGDQAMLRDVIESVLPGQRFRRIVVSPRLREGAPAQVAVSGYRWPDRQENFYVAISAADESATAQPPQSAVRDEISGLLDERSFGEVAEARIREANESGEDYTLTLMSLTEIETLNEGIGVDAADQLMAKIGDSLRGLAVDGELAGQFDETTFGVIHRTDADVNEVKSEIGALVHEAVPNGEGFEITDSQVKIDTESIDARDSVKAVLFTISKFSEAAGRSFDIDSLTDGYTEMVRESTAELARFKEIVSKKAFVLALQPIVDLRTREIHHYECLTRFPDQEDGASPFKRITFAEEVGGIVDFDIAVMRRAIEIVDLAKARDGSNLLLAVNISGLSLESPGFADALIGLFQDRPKLRKNFALEVTESARINDLEATNLVIQRLRKVGHAVCLDDFGSGASAFQYLHVLEVDIVKIDGGYVRDATHTAAGKSFLKAMAGLCHDLDIAVVAEMVGTEKTVEFLKECGVQYAQGYLFGKPTLAYDPTVSNPSRLPVKRAVSG